MNADVFLLIADPLPEAMLLVEGGEIVAANAAVRQLLGWPPDGLRGRRLAQLVADPADALTAFVRRCAHSRELVLGELQVRHADGSVVDCRALGAVVRPRTAVVEPLIALRLEPRAAAALHERAERLERELERRTQVESELRARRRVLELALGDIGDGVIATDARGRVVLMNRAAEALAGWSEAEAAGHRADEVFVTVAAGTGAPGGDPVAAVLGSGRAVDTRDAMLVRRGGRELPIRNRAAPIDGPDGTVDGVVVVFHEDAGRGSRGRTIPEGRTDAFLSLLAHQLRNPLAPIRSAVDLLERADTTDDRRERAVAVIGRQSRQMARIVDDLLDLSRIANGQVQLDRRRIDLQQVLAPALDAARPLIEARLHDLEVAVPETPVRLHADPARLEKVLETLLDNAARYTPEHGRIALRASCDGGWLVLRVADSGAGIAAERLAGIFDVFPVEQNAAGRGRGGLGIGLALARALVELHGGAMEARSEGPGRGAEFAVRLPLAPEEA